MSSTTPETSPDFTSAMQTLRGHTSPEFFPNLQEKIDSCTKDEKKQLLAQRDHKMKCESRQWDAWRVDAHQGPRICAEIQEHLKNLRSLIFD